MTKMHFLTAITLLCGAPIYAQTVHTNPDSIPFAPAANYGAGDYPSAVFCAPLDVDQHLDLAVANSGSDNVSVLENNGDGTFQAKIDYGTGDYPSSVFCADLNGDGHFDLVLANQGTDNVSVLMNNGDGTYQARVDYPAGSHAHSVFCEDLDGDSHLDLAVTNHYGNSVSILINDGDGTFQTKVDYAVGTRPRFVFCADLDGDLASDLVVTNTGNDDISILRNDGNGSFPTRVDLAVGDNPLSVFCADLDADLDLDLAVANFNSDDVSILLNDGDGTFPTRAEYGAGDGPISVFCADLDRDGHVDLAVANGYGDNVSILRNVGDGTFQTKVDYAVGTGPHSVFCADLDGDSFLDLATANVYDDNVSILKNLAIENITRMQVGAIMVSASTFVHLGGGDFRAEGNVWIGDQTGADLYFYLGDDAEVTFNANTGTVTDVTYTNTKLTVNTEDYVIDSVTSLEIDAQQGLVAFNGKVHYAADAIFQGSFSGPFTLQVNQRAVGLRGAVKFDDAYFGVAGRHAGFWDFNGCPFMGISDEINLTTPVQLADWTVIDGEVTLGVFLNTGIFRVGRTAGALEIRESGGAFWFNLTGTVAPPGVPSQCMIEVDLTNLRVNVVEDIPIALLKFKNGDDSEIESSGLRSKAPRTDWATIGRNGENTYPADVYDADGEKHQKLGLDVGVTIRGEEGYDDINCNGIYDFGIDVFIPYNPAYDDDMDGEWDEGTNIELRDEYLNDVFNVHGHATLDLTLLSLVHFTATEVILDIDYPNNTRVRLEILSGLKLGNVFEVYPDTNVIYLNFEHHYYYADVTLRHPQFTMLVVDANLRIELDPLRFEADMNEGFDVLGVDFHATGQTLELNESGFHSSCYVDAFGLLGAEAQFSVAEQAVDGSFTTAFSIDGWNLAELGSEFHFAPGQCMSVSASVEFCPLPGFCPGAMVTFRICDALDWGVVINGTYFRLKCPADLHVYDSQGRHTGLNLSGGLDLEIPGSEFYFSEDSSQQLIFIPGFDLSDVYTVDIVGDSTGLIDLDVLYPNPLDSKVYDFTFFDEPTEQGALHRVILDSTNTWTMFHDLDGDSVFEGQTEPDSSAEATLDTTMVAITNVSSEILCANEVSVTWNTNVPATSEVLYRSEYDSTYQSVSDTALTTSHSVIVDEILSTDTYYYVVVSVDTSGNIASFLEKSFNLDYVVGDVNFDGVINIGDVVYLINYLYRSGSAPDPLEVGDANCDGVVQIGDVVYLVNYLYRQGPPPCR